MTDPIQQQLIAARKNQILDAAAAVFAEKGFHTTTIRDVSKFAGISDGTIYNYFDSKTELLLGIFERMRATIVQTEMPLPDADIDFRALVRAFVYHPLMALRGDNFALFRIVLSEIMINDDLRKQYYTQILAPSLDSAEPFFIAHAAKRGISPDRARLTLRAISGMVMGLILERIMGDSDLADQWDELPDVLTDLLLDGLDPNTDRE